jgi:hypothetical protein
VAIAATVIQVPLKPTTRAPLAMATEQTRSTVHNLLHHFTMPRRYIVRLKKRLAVITKDVGQFMLLL